MLQIYAAAPDPTESGANIKEVFIMTGIEYSEARGTWNLYVDGEWIYEGTYEQCEAMYYNCMEYDD